jgi:rhodanese-related sulfurtransferase
MGLLGATILFVFAACSPAAERVPEQEEAVSTKNADGYTDIAAQQLAQMLESKDFTLVNVHIPYEGEIPQTDAFLPYNEIVDHQDELPGKTEPIVLYCRSGSMSTTAANTLVSLGYTDVYEVDGGMVAWGAAGQEVLNR